MPDDHWRPGQRRIGPPDWVPEAARLYALGLPSAEVGRRVGSNPATVLLWLRREGVAIRRQGPVTGVRLPAVVHLMITDPDDPDWRDDPDYRIFTRCCGINWAALISKDL